MLSLLSAPACNETGVVWTPASEAGHGRGACSPWSIATAATSARVSSGAARILCSAYPFNLPQR